MKAGYEIGPFRLDAQAGVLTREGVPVPLGSRAVAVLAALVEHAHEHVPKARILDAAWPGLVVEESNLSVQISAIRRALSQVPGGDRWVETLARRGYRFVGPVSALHEAGTAGAGMDASRTNLPERLTSFVGRTRELAEVSTILDRARMVTLTGPGGIGKTRIALEIARARLGSEPDGVWFVDLAPIADPAFVAATFAEALRLRQARGGPGLELLCAQVRDRRMLVVLDNCEHVLDAAAPLCEAILRAAPGVRILATTREPLRVVGENVYAVAPLSLPQREAGADELGASEAERLFVERVREQRPDFQPDAAQARVIAELCVHLDGIPLALELAAARSRSLSLEHINARIDDRFRLLSGGPRTAMPRQQTLHATLDWSHDLLTPEERALLRRLAVFAGGFTLEAAIDVAALPPLQPREITDLLSQLVTRSWVVADTRRGEVRYGLLETMRAYALERLDAAGETAAVRERHAQHVRARFGRALDDWLRIADGDWRERYVPELGNVRAALGWALDGRPDPDMAAELAGASGPLWTTLSLYGEGLAWLARACEVARADDAARRAPIWLWRGVLADNSAAEAHGMFEQAMRAYLEAGDGTGYAHVLLRLARVAATMGRADESEALLEQAYPVLQKASLPKLMGFYHTNHGYLAMMRGDLSAARHHYEQALGRYEECGAEFSRHTTLSNLADVVWALGDLDAAADAFRDLVGVVRANPRLRRSSLGFALGNLAGVLVERGDGASDEAAAAVRESAPLLRDSGFAWLFMDHYALYLAVRGRATAAARLAGHAAHALAERKTERQPNEARARARVEQLLAQALGAPTLERLRREGEALTEADAVQLLLA